MSRWLIVYDSSRNELERLVRYNDDPLGSTLAMYERFATERRYAREGVTSRVVVVVGADSFALLYERYRHYF